jgi:hypothetical protein
MGGLVVRRMLALRPMRAPGRMVMIAPPNCGSALARRMLRTRAARALAGPAACEMAGCCADVSCLAPAARNTSNGLDTTLFAEPGAPAMIIAGTQSFSPLSINAWISAALRIHGRSANDGTVAVHETRLPHETHFVRIHDHHSHLVRNQQVIQAAVGFFQESIQADADIVC